MLSNIDEKDNLARMERGELYYAFSPELVAARKRCGRIVGQLNRAGELSRRGLAVYWKEYVLSFTFLIQEDRVFSTPLD
jgi:hypothetical protein